jgi:hypothetical protein
MSVPLIYGRFGPLNSMDAYHKITAQVFRKDTTGKGEEYSKADLYFRTCETITLCDIYVGVDNTKNDNFVADVWIAGKRRAHTMDCPCFLLDGRDRRMGRKEAPKE